MVVGMSLYAQIREAYISGESQRSIARRLGVSRPTVKKYCEGASMPGVRKEYLRAPSVVTPDVERFIRFCLETDKEEGLRKQSHTAKRIYDRLVSEIGFTGSYSIVRRVVHEMKAHYIPAQADIPLEYDPGDAIQIDWGEATIYLHGEKKTVQIFCGRLCYSCDIFVMACLNQNAESFLEAQQRMFDHFVGVPRRLIFDNGKVGVKEGFGLHAVAQDYYRIFAAHYVFATDFCNVASGNEKGLVENLVGYSRNNFLVPVPRVDSMDSLNEQLLESCLQYRNTHKVQGRSQTVKEMFATEQSCLHPVAPYRYETAKVTTPTVGDYSTVRFDRNEYSVPVRFLRRAVTVKGYANKVEILCDRDTVVTYERLSGQGKTTYKLEHYIGLLERKPRSVFQAKPVRQTVKQELLELGQHLPGGNKDMVRLLRMCVDYGEDRVIVAKNRIPVGITPTVDIIRSYLEEPAQNPIIPFRKEVSINQTNLAYYDEKCGVAAR